MTKDLGSVAKNLLDWLDLHLVSIKPLQSLWAGYGSICAITARAKTDDKAARIMKGLYGISEAVSRETDIPLILKFVSPPAGGAKDEGHHRKMLSYEVERFFYATFEDELPEDAKVAPCMISAPLSSDGVIALVLADLRINYPVAGGKREVLATNTVHAAIDWLGCFHRVSKAWIKPGAMGRYVLPPLDEVESRANGQKEGSVSSVWFNGGYTYLATRRKEYADLEADKDSEWSGNLCSVVDELGCAIAEAVAKVLTPRGRAVESFIHGDVKSENLFATQAGDKVAFFDFQYVGLGLGVCDLAKLFTCSVPEEMLDSSSEAAISACDGELKLLSRYREVLLRGRSSEEYPEALFKRHWECALVDWCRFQASWGFWGNTDWLEGRVRSILRDESWRQWLKAELEACP